MPGSSLDFSKSLKYGPSGRAVAQELDINLLDNLHEHITMERIANVQYFSMSLWFKERELRGFSSFFLKESNDELIHAQKFTDYLIARGYKINLKDIPSPVQEWDSIQDLINFSFKMESDLTTSIEQLYSMAERASDIRTNVFLDPIVELQIKSEDTFAYLLGKVKFSENQPSAILIIDKELNEK
tara:strand:- start:902 stop:1456 length:555 start_codon:yes stop_codon:yes gene_type:complete